MNMDLELGVQGGMLIDHTEASLNSSPRLSPILAARLIIRVVRRVCRRCACHYMRSQNDSWLS